MIDHYRYELYQSIYDPEFVRGLIEKLDRKQRERKEVKKRDEELLSKLT